VYLLNFKPEKHKCKHVYDDGGKTIYKEKEGGVQEMKAKRKLIKEDAHVAIEDRKSRKLIRNDILLRNSMLPSFSSSSASYAAFFSADHKQK
jgi:hypothetical protein